MLQRVSARAGLHRRRMRGTGELAARTNQLQRHLRQHENRPQPLRLVHEHVRIRADLRQRRMRLVLQGRPNGGVGVHGTSAGFDAVVGETNSHVHAGVTGRDFTNGANGGVGLYGVGGKFAGKFDGDVQINGDPHLAEPSSPMFSRSW